MDRTLADAEAAGPDSTFEAQGIKIGAANGAGDLEAVVRPAPGQPPSVYAVDKKGAYSRALTILRILQLQIFVRGVAPDDARLGGVEFVEAVDDDDDGCSGAACFLWQFLRLKPKTKGGGPSHSVAWRLGRQVVILRLWRSKGFVGLSDELLAACSDTRDVLYSAGGAIFLEALLLAAIEWMRLIKHGPRPAPISGINELSRDATGVFNFYKNDVLVRFCRGAADLIEQQQQRRQEGDVELDAETPPAMGDVVADLMDVLEVLCPFDADEAPDRGGAGGAGGEEQEGSGWGSKEQEASDSGSDDSGSGGDEQEDSCSEHAAVGGAQGGSSMASQPPAGKRLRSSTPAAAAAAADTTSAARIAELQRELRDAKRAMNDARRESRCKGRELEQMRKRPQTSDASTNTGPEGD